MNHDQRKKIADSVYSIRLDPAEFERRLQALRTPEDDAERLALIQWFRRRYPTVRERWKYISERTRAWQRAGRIRRL